MSMHESNFLSGGPLGLDARVAQIFLAHIEICCATDEETGAAAARRRDKMLEEIDEKQHGYVQLVASAMTRLTGG